MQTWIRQMRRTLRARRVRRARRADSADSTDSADFGGLGRFGGFSGFDGWRTITHRISETNSSFRGKQRIVGKVKFLFYKSFLLVLTKLSFWQGNWALGYHSMGFRQFPDISLSRSTTRKSTHIYHVYK